MMDPFAPTDTIAALSTPPGQAGIGIIRISGPLALVIAQRIFRPRHPISTWLSHRLYLGSILDPVTGNLVDEVLVSTMHAPHSYTREDVVEINAHSGYALMGRILDIVLDSGARQAKPGEFTFRAFVNGRIDLTQAEAIMDLIQARSERGVELASRQLRGSLKRRIHEVREALLTILAHTEVAIDYPEEGYGLVPGEEASTRVRAEILDPLEEICADHGRNRIWVEGGRAAIVGRVNVGKSSILNRLVGNDRAIVTPEPGTTRDVIEETIHIEGLPVRLLDTAGYRTPTSRAERIGIGLMEQCIDDADLALWVVDRNSTLEHEDRRILERCKGKPTLAVVNKVDLPPRLHDSEIKEACGELPVLRVSAHSGEGVNGLLQAIRNSLLAEGGGAEETVFAPNARQNRVLKEACSHMRRAVENLHQEAPLEIVAMDLQGARSALDEVSGVHAPEDVLERIFSEFCLGK